MKTILKGATVAVIGVLYLVGLSACMKRDDGAGDLWRAVKYMERRR